MDEEKQDPGQRIEEEWWRPPKPSEIKINFDGAFYRQTSKSGTVIISKDSEGKILNCTTVVNNRIPTLFVTKALPYLQAVKTSLDMGLQKVVVEGDAFNIIKKIQNNEKDKSILI